MKRGISDLRTFRLCSTSVLCKSLPWSIPARHKAILSSYLVCFHKNKSEADISVSEQLNRTFLVGEHRLLVYLVFRDCLYNHLDRTIYSKVSRAFTVSSLMTVHLPRFLTVIRPLQYRQHSCRSPVQPPSIYKDIEGISLSEQGAISIPLLYVLPKGHTYLIDAYQLLHAAFSTTRKHFDNCLNAILEAREHF